MKIDDLVILVGGRGSRLGKLTNITPKPLIKINNIPFVEHLLLKVIKFKFRHIYLLCSYKKEKFFKKYHKKKLNHSKIICVDEGKQKGTGGALYKLKDKIRKNFILLNGDTFFDINLDDLIKSDLKKGNIAKICLTDIKNSYNNNIFTNLELKKNLKINFSRKKTNLMNGGVYLFSKKIFSYIDKRKLSLENDILYKLILKKKVIGKFYSDKFIDIGSIKKLNYIKKNNNFLKNKAVFLDRDGVINKHDGYILNYRNFIFLRGVKKAIKYANYMRYLVIIITNQSSVGRSYMNEKQLKLIHNKMTNELSKSKAYLDDIFYSPYYKNSKYKKFRLSRNDRKPGNGMLKKAIKKWNVDINSSIFIGDSCTDKIAANRTKLKFYFKKKNSLYEQLKKII